VGLTSKAIQVLSGQEYVPMYASARKAERVHLVGRHPADIVVGRLIRRLDPFCSDRGCDLRDLGPYLGGMLMSQDAISAELDTDLAGGKPVRRLPRADEGWCGG
jgi:hypothetical protein